MTGGYRVAVVGGGIFGVTSAVQLARAGHDVVLFEAAADLLGAASEVNQRRLHRGYHYPRSMATAQAARLGARSFSAEYPEAVQPDYRHYVAIARKDSLVDASAYVAFCDRIGLDYVEEYPSFLRRSAVEVSLRISEDAIDVDALRRSCWSKLMTSGVDVRLRTPFQIADAARYERVVLATYAQLNHLQSAVPGGARDYQFEVCEKPVVRLPAPYRDRSLVVLDGDFMCVDPFRRDGSFLLGNVMHAIHATTIGRFPLIPAHLVANLNRGITRSPSTRISAFLQHAREYFTGLDSAEYQGSLFTVRAVLPGLESNDARPTVVRRLDERTIAIFGGKIATCVEAARDATALVNEPTAPATVSLKS